MKGSDNCGQRDEGTQKKKEKPWLHSGRGVSCGSNPKHNGNADSVVVCCHCAGECESKT